MKHYISPRWSFEITDCSMPMTFDTYSNCSFTCLYCFSQYQRGIGARKEKYEAKEVSWVDVNKIKKMFLEPESSQFKDFVKQKKVMQWGGLSDPFDLFEKKHGITLELLRFFREIEYPICFSTKGTWWLDDDRYVELFKGADYWNVKFSIITGDEYKAKRIEKGVLPPSERIKAIEKYSKLNNGGATLRLRPFIIGVSNPSYVQLIIDCANAGATALSTEFFCLEMRTPSAKPHYDRMSELCGFDIIEFYRTNSYGSGYLRLNRNIKRPFVNKMEALCNEHGLRFYVSDAHFKERCHNGSCCGLPPTWNYSKGQFCEALLKAKAAGQVKWSDIEHDLQYAKAFEWKKACGYNNAVAERRAQYFNATMYDYLKSVWNNPNVGQSPYKMFEGILKPCGRDDHGDVVYQYDNSRA